MIKIPPYLVPGDTIGIVCPAGYMPYEKAQNCIETLHKWGYETKPGKTLASVSSNYFSGTDKERLEDLQQMMDNDEVQAVLCGRGGYGIGRIIDHLSFKKFKKKPKWLIGFSDVTILHAHIYSNLKIATLHSPMAAAFNDDQAKENEYLLSIKKALEGGNALYKCGSHPFNKQGKASAELIGGNLALIAHIIGTSSDIKTKGRILFLEDVGEYMYNVDRMFYQLKRSGKLDKLAGLIIGGFTDMKDTERPFGKTVYEIIRDVIQDQDYPICFNFPVSHGKENYALKHGLRHKLLVRENEVVLEEA